MSIQHDHYSALCALAAAGQLADEELASLRAHADGCDECRRALDDFRHIAAEVLQEYAIKQFPVKTPAGMTSRFIARARSEGVPLKHSKDPTHSAWFPSFRLVAEYVGAALLLALTSQFLLTHWRVKYGPATTHTTQSSYVTDPGLVAENRELIRQFHALQAKADASARQLASRQESFEADRSELLRLQIRLAELEGTNLNLRRQAADRDVRISELSADRDQLKAEVDNLRSTKMTDDLLLHANESELEDLRFKVAALNEQINERQQLSGAAEQAKDLIVARNLHIVDVHDNKNGDRPRPFGRIFYTEGKKLIFYAYDLGDTKTTARVTFYVWGERSGTTQQAKHLGILRADDKRDGRWVVTFDDPQILAEINTVFVTAESPKKQPMKPSGTRILVAFLDGAPNHP